MPVKKDMSPLARFFIPIPAYGRKFFLCSFFTGAGI